VKRREEFRQWLLKVIFLSGSMVC